MVDALIADGKLTLGGEKEKMTIMFCDVRGFTAISEVLEKPEVLASYKYFINRLTNDILNVVERLINIWGIASWHLEYPVENLNMQN